MSQLRSGTKRQMTRLMAIANGPGSLRISPRVASLEMFIKKKTTREQRGAKHFWRHCLPGVQFHNSQLPITVHNTEAASTESTLLKLFVKYADGSVKTIPMADRSQDEILEDFVTATEAEPVQKYSIPQYTPAKQ